MSILPKALQKLIEQFTKLPGIGPRTATRLSFSMLKWSADELADFAESISGLTSGIVYCRECHTMSESEFCRICSDKSRDKSIIAVVEKALDVAALESIGDYHGVYHVLGGTIIPIEGVGPDDLRIKELLKKVERGNIKEIILATNADLEGETTAMYLARELQNLNVKITRIARGLPMGGEIEYADEITLTSALEGRREYGK